METDAPPLRLPGSRPELRSHVTTILHLITVPSDRRTDGDAAKKQRAQRDEALAGAQEELARLTG